MFIQCEPVVEFVEILLHDLHHIDIVGLVRVLPTTVFRDGVLPVKIYTLWFSLVTG